MTVMEHLLFIMIGTLLLMIAALAAKVYFLRKSTREIADAFRERLTADTNTLIGISSRDGAMRAGGRPKRPAAPAARRASPLPAGRQGAQGGHHSGRA